MADDEIARAWDALVVNWESAEAHEQFLKLADAAERLVEIARLYRGVRDEDDGRRPVAERQLEALTARALSRLATTRPAAPPPSRSRVEWIALGVSAVLGTAALWQLLRVL